MTAINQTVPKETILSDTEQYRLVLRGDDVLLFDWKSVKGLSASDFRQGILAYAQQCQQHGPAKAVINAMVLDQTSEAIAWLRGDNSHQNESYDDWWAREIVPLYHSGNIATLAVATGDPNAPGELPNVPSFVKFKIGYFPDLQSSLQW